MMFLARLYDAKLAQAGYLIGCSATGEAVAIDPLRDAAPYLQAAASEGLRITHVTETHIHADFVSGSRELAARTGARVLLSAEGGADWQYRWAREAGAVLLRDGDTFDVGRIRVQVLHTPGHTPEHLCFMITDTAATDRPMGVFTGDFIFAGDVGRPDLLERAAHMVGTMESSARTLHRSLRRFLELPDYLQLWPGHGAGSACGKALGAVPSTTLGYERLVNWGLTTEDEDEFVRLVLSGQPEPPPYFARMKVINRDGPPLLAGVPRPARMPGAELPPLLAAGGLVVDTRPAAEFAAAHVPGTINLPLGRSFLGWAGWLLPYDRPIHLLVDGGERPREEAVRDLSVIGIDRVAGVIEWHDARQAWRAAGRELAEVPQIDPATFAARLRDGSVVAVDVRNAGEWEAGHVPGIVNVPLGHLAEREDEVPTGRPVVVYCQGGGRSAIAASLLRARGRTDVINLAGGFQAWRAAGGAVESPSAASAESAAPAGSR